jgi:hypothetical protein
MLKTRAGQIIGNIPILGDYISVADLARELRVCRRTLDRWRYRREGPSPTMIGMRVYYHRDSVRKWLESREQTMVRAVKGRAA